MSDLNDERETGVTSNGGSGSFMDRVRGQHQKLQDSKELTVDIPGYEGLLAVKYRVLDVKGDLSPIGKKIAVEFSDQVEGALYSSIDAMAKACIEIYGVKESEDGERQLTPLAEIMDWDTPVRYNRRLAEFMGWSDLLESGTARQVVLRLFGDTETMILDHAMMLNRWMTNTTRQVNDQFLGELGRSRSSR